jgi:hypothetical protein
LRGPGRYSLAAEVRKVKLVGSVKDGVRRLLRIKVDRHMPAPGAKPAIGARICRGDVRMTVQAGLTDQHWRWLVKNGWREITYRPDRRRYRDIPSAYVMQVIDASIEQLERVLAAAVSHATYRPVPSNRGPWATPRNR